jgi:phage shock protein PspC (stress-responsive transcriptional regulator)
MQSVQQRPSLFTRDDTFLGVCEGLGEDFGFHPNLLRVTLAFLCFFYPAAVIASYLGLGLLVAATRWVAPNVVADSPIVEAATLASVDSVDREIVEEDGQRRLPLAA